MNLRPYLQFNRKISESFSRLLVRTPVTPNFITFCGVVCAALGALSMLPGNRAALLMGAFWMHGAFILDNCDGEVARKKGLASAFGRWWDSGCDVAVDILLWAGLYFAVFGSGQYLVSLWFWLATAGSLINFMLVVWERKAGCSSSIHDTSSLKAEREGSSFFSVLDALAHNGDSAALIWLMAFVGNPAWFLVCGAFYVNALWMTRFFANAGRLLRHAGFGMWKWLWRVAALGLGLWILFQVLNGISWMELMVLVKRAGLPLLLTLGIFPMCTLYHTMAFRGFYPEEIRNRMPFKDLYWINLTGEAFNKVTPFLDIGGDPVKALLLKKHGFAEMEESITALIAFRISFVISEIITVLAGLAVLSILNPSANIALWAGVAVVVSAIYILIIAGSSKKLIGKDGSRNLAGLLRFSSRGLWTAIFWNVAGWITLCIEAYMVLRLLEVPISFIKTFSVQSLLQAVQTLTFYIPANIGSQEGGLAFLMDHFGLSAASGVALSIVKRARQILWALAAIPFYYALKNRRVEK